MVFDNIVFHKGEIDMPFECIRRVVEYTRKIFECIRKVVEHTRKVVECIRMIFKYTRKVVECTRKSSVIPRQVGWKLRLLYFLLPIITIF